MENPIIYREYSNAYHAVLLVWIAIFLFLYKTIVPKLSSYYQPQYSHLSTFEKHDWDLRIVSNMHAIIVSFLSLYETFFDGDIQRDPIWASSAVVRTNLAIMAAFFLTDIFVMMTDFKQDSEVFLYYFHHSATVWVNCYGYCYGLLAYFANFRLLAELSTPFVNQRWFFDILGYKRTSSAYIINGLLLTFAFVGVRVCLMPFYWYKIYGLYTSPHFPTLGPKIWILMISTGILDVLNIQWSYKLIKGAFKILSARFIVDGNGISKTKDKQF